jgi:hypothetical protein
MKLYVPVDRATGKPLCVNTRDTDFPERYIQTNALVATETREQAIEILEKMFGCGPWLGDVRDGKGRFELVLFDSDPDQLAASMGAACIFDDESTVQ